MPKRSSKPGDLNSLASAIVAQATDDDKLDNLAEESEREKDPAAVALGRRGGLVGGKARAAKLSDERKREIAQAAARKRWGKT